MYEAQDLFRALLEKGRNEPYKAKKKKAEAPASEPLFDITAALTELELEIA